MSRLKPGQANPVAARGCGAHRKKGGVYLECGLSAGGSPLETFICDPPVDLPAGLRVSKRGVTAFPGPDGTVHLLDWIGSGNYPYPSDILEEVRQQGLSRNVSASVGNLGLSRGSLIFLVHERAILENPAEVNCHLFEEEARLRCRNFVLTGSAEHLELDVACSRHFYAEASPTHDLEDEAGNVIYQRRFTESTWYRVNPFEPAAEPRYREGIIARLPLTHISVVKGGDPDVAAELRKKILGVDVSVTDT